MSNSVRAMRTRRGMTQGELARAADTQQAVISALETGRRTVSPAIQQRIAAALNCQVEELFDAEELKVVGAGTPRLRARRTPASEDLRESGRLLRNMRIKRDFSQLELSDKSGVAPATISALEKGLRSALPRTWQRLAEALRCNPEEIHPDIWGGAAPVESQGARTAAAMSPAEPERAPRDIPFHEIRVASGYSTPQLATDTAIPLPRLLRIEAGVVDPSPVEARLLSLLLNRTEAELFTPATPVQDALVKADEDEYEEEAPPVRRIFGKPASSGSSWGD